MIYIGNRWGIIIMERDIKKPFSISGKIWNYTVNQETSVNFRIDDYWPKIHIFSELEKFLRGDNQEGR